MGGGTTLKSADPRPRGRLREYRTSLGGVRTRAIEVHGSGPPAVLLHGWCDSADSWRNLLERYRDLGRSAIAYDMPGFGFSQPVDFPEPILESQVRFASAAVRRAADEHGAEVILAGNSLGGWTTLRAAEQSGLPLAGIVLVAPAGIQMSPWFFRLDTLPWVSELLAIPTPVPQAVVRSVVAQAVRRVGFGEPERIDERFVRSFSLHNRDRRWARLRIAAVRSTKAELERPFDPSRIDVPAVVVWGTRDVLCLPAGAEPLAATLGARLELIPRCGHLPQVERPELVLAAIEELADGA